jgi:hypothetical protein
MKKAFRQEKSKQPKAEIKTEKEATFGPGMSKSFCVLFVV